MNPYRTHICGALNVREQGERVVLAGWLHRKRDHGGLLFLDIRDHSGFVQCVLEPKERTLFDQASECPLETVIQIEGTVALREKTTQNVHIPTGMIEIQVISLKILSALTLTLPFPVSGIYDYTEEVRLKNRFLDLRREEIRERIFKRSDFLRLLREGAYREHFTEVQTPILTSSSPEGARDFLVPSRRHRGCFYALPQAPQLFKQFLMVGGFHRYYQIAPCFRDEDARADRSPGEFYQLDMEMSFTTEQEIMEISQILIEPAFSQIKPKGWSMSAGAWSKISYKQAMEVYGTDRPDMRNPLKICDVSDLFQKSGVELRLFREILQKGGCVKGIPAPKGGQLPRSFFDEMNNWARSEGAGGLGYLLFEQESAKGPIARFLPSKIIASLRERAGLQAGDALFFACDQKKKAMEIAGKARLKIGKHLDCCEQKHFHFCWITNIPLYQHDGKHHLFSHNPFSMPDGGMQALEQQDPSSILAKQYDLVCNGVELSSGAIRAHDPAILLRSFAIAGYSEEKVNASFPALMRALRMGAPPHGGIAHGIERMLMLLCLQDNVREVIAFPMNQQAQDVMMGAPGKPLKGHMEELGLRIVEKE